MNILMTGFDPFGGEPINPAAESIYHLNNTTIADASVHTIVIPTVRYEAIEALKKGIDQYDPSLIICVGQAGGRPDITIERVAINIDDFRIKDNAGNQPIDEPIVPGGSAAYWSTLPIKKIVTTLRQHNIPASISQSAGTFICNHLFYGLMDTLAKEGNIRRGGLIHIPYLPEQAARNPGQPSMSLDVIIRGLRLAVETAIYYKEDEKSCGGTIC